MPATIVETENGYLITTCDGSEISLLDGDVNNPSNYGDCDCLYCQKYRQMTTIPGFQDDIAWLDWFHSCYSARKFHELSNTVHATCLNQIILDNCYVILNKILIYEFKMSEDYMASRYMHPTTLISKWVDNIGGKRSMCPYYVAQCSIDAGYFFGYHYTQPLLCPLYYAKKEEVGVADDFDMQHLNMAKRRTIEEAQTTDWFDVHLVPITLHRYLNQENQALVAAAAAALAAPDVPAVEPVEPAVEPVEPDVPVVQVVLAGEPSGASSNESADADDPLNTGFVAEDNQNVP
jgi:hypothetical protein